MRLPPTSPTNLAERHVQLSEFVDVSIHSMTDTQMATIIGPSMHAQQLERMMRTVEIPDVQPVPQVARASCCVRAYKRTCDTASLVCGVAAMPLFALAAVHPFLLVIPAGLITMSMVCFCLRGKPTTEMQQEYETRRVFAQRTDSQGV